MTIPKLLGKKVKVGDRVRLGVGYLAEITSITDTIPGYPFTIDKSYTVDSNGQQLTGHPDAATDVIEVLLDTTGQEDTPFFAYVDKNELDLFELRKEMCFLQQSLEETRAELDRTREELREQINHTRDVVDANLSLLAECREAQANEAKYKRILTGR